MATIQIKITRRVTIKGNPAFRRELESKLAAGRRRAAEFVAEECRKTVSRTNPYVKISAAGNARYLNMRNLDAGGPPFRRSGAGGDSIRAIGDKVEMLARMAMLDLGTTRIQPRPWYYRTIEQNARRIVTLAAGK